MSILSEYLRKIGVKSYDELTSDEKETYKEWEISISGRKLTDDDVRSFIETELQTAILRLTEVNLSIEDQAFRKAEVKLIQKIIKFLDSPKVEKTMVERQVKSLMESKV